LIPLPPEEKDKTYSRLINERHVDGLIVSGPTEDDQDLLDAFNNGAKIVLMSKVPGSNIPFIDINNQKGAEIAVSHLVELGHKHIAAISNAPLNYSGSKERIKGYKNVLQRNNLRIDDELIFIGDRTPESGYKAMKTLLKKNSLPSAVFIASDTVALGALNALYENNVKVPDDIAIVGFDDIALAQYVIPPLTTVHLPAYSIGLGAASMLIQQLNNNFKESREIILQTRLIIRESSGKRIND
jgi:DNA-binding LacI/PurR family transcriptional regulator